jgi:hypothetical protein
VISGHDPVTSRHDTPGTLHRVAGFTNVTQHAETERSLRHDYDTDDHHRRRLRRRHHRPERLERICAAVDDGGDALDARPTHRARQRRAHQGRHTRPRPTHTLRNIMNTTLATERRQDSPVHHENDARPVRRVGLIDRAALHLGMALITWGRRPAASAARAERRANRVELALLHHERQLAQARYDRLKATSGEHGRFIQLP